MGQPSSGSGGSPGSDLALATRLAMEGITALGLDGDGGLVWTGAPLPHIVAERLATNRDLGAQVRARLDEVYARARTLVRERHAALVALAGSLVERRALDGPEAEAIMARAQEREP